MRAFSKLYTASAAFLVSTGILLGVSSSSFGGNGASRQASAADFGVLLVTNQKGMFVAQVVGPLAAAGLKRGDEIVAVNGRRVASERAFVGRLTAGAGANLTVSRQNDTLTISAPVSMTGRPTAATSAGAASTSAAIGGSGIINPANMVVTADGRIMHKAVAARLGLPSRPLETTSHSPPPGAIH
jgi:membrane-associated protease RseP (regulator of RpoE activity)